MKSLRRLELFLFVIGSAAAALFCVLCLHAAFIHRSQVVHTSSFDGTYSQESADIKEGSVIGTLRIPELKIASPVVEGVNDLDLRGAIGHVRGSAGAGGLGNAILAAHRDGIFRPLQKIYRGMRIDFDGPSGTYHYQVDETSIVTPEHVEVMAIGSQPGLTLITCYPFGFIGAAPKRFIVQAHLGSVAPDQP